MLLPLNSLLLICMCSHFLLAVPLMGLKLFCCIFCSLLLLLLWDWNSHKSSGLLLDGWDINVINKWIFKKIWLNFHGSFNPKGLATEKHEQNSYTIALSHTLLRNSWDFISLAGEIGREIESNESFCHMKCHFIIPRTLWTLDFFDPWYHCCYTCLYLYFWKWFCFFIVDLVSCLLCVCLSFYFCYWTFSMLLCLLLNCLEQNI